jgi:hypothetical protein
LLTFTGFILIDWGISVGVRTTLEATGIWVVAGLGIVTFLPFGNAEMRKMPSLSLFLANEVIGARSNIKDAKLPKYLFVIVCPMLNRQAQPTNKNSVNCSQVIC